MNKEEAISELEAYVMNNSNYDEEVAEAIQVVLAELEKKDKLLKCIFKNERLDCYDLRLNIEPENQDCRHIGDFSCKECIERYFEKKVGE